MSISQESVRKHHKQHIPVLPLPDEGKTKQSEIFDEAVKLFETKCQKISNFCCKVCLMTGIRIKPSQCNPSICTTCQAQKATKEEKLFSLPV